MEPGRLSHQSSSLVSLGLTKMTEGPLTKVSLGDHSRKEVEDFSHLTLTTLRKDTFWVEQRGDVSIEISVQLPFPFVLQATA